MDEAGKFDVGDVTRRTVDSFEVPNGLCTVELSLEILGSSQPRHKRLTAGTRQAIEIEQIYGKFMYHLRSWVDFVKETTSVVLVENSYSFINTCTLEKLQRISHQYCEHQLRVNQHDKRYLQAPWMLVTLYQELAMQRTFCHTNEKRSITKPRGIPK